MFGFFKKKSVSPTSQPLTIPELSDTERREFWEGGKLVIHDDQITSNGEYTRKHYSHDPKPVPIDCIFVIDDVKYVYPNTPDPKIDRRDFDCYVWEFMNRVQYEDGLWYWEKNTEAYDAFFKVIDRRKFFQTESRIRLLSENEFDELVSLGYAVFTPIKYPYNVPDLASYISKHSGWLWSDTAMRAAFQELIQIQFTFREIRHRIRSKSFKAEIKRVIEDEAIDLKKD